MPVSAATNTRISNVCAPNEPLCRKSMRVSTPINSAMSANMAMDVQGRTIDSLCAKGRSGDSSARPGPLKIEATDTPVDVENLPDERQPLAHPRTHRRRIDFVERDASSRRFGDVVAAIAD